MSIDISEMLSVQKYSDKIIKEINNFSTKPFKLKFQLQQKELHNEFLQVERGNKTKYEVDKELKVLCVPCEVVFHNYR